MSNDQENHDQWTDCPAGELSRMVTRLDASQSRARTRKLYQTGVLSMLLVAAGVVVAGSLFAPGGNKYGGITCAECKSHFESYHGHLTGTAQIDDDGLTQSIATHLANCGFCQEFFKQSYPGVLNQTVAASTRPAVVHLIPTLAASWQMPLY